MESEAIGLFLYPTIAVLMLFLLFPIVTIVFWLGRVVVKREKFSTVKKIISAVWLAVSIIAFALGQSLFESLISAALVFLIMMVLVRTVGVFMRRR